MTSVNSRVSGRSKLLVGAGHTLVMTVLSLPVTGGASRGKAPCVGVKTTAATLTTSYQQILRLPPGVVYLMLFILRKKRQKKMM